jgi:hypothetical protein
MPAGEYDVVVHRDAYDPESELFKQLDTAEPNQLAVFHKLGRICQAIDAGEDASDGTVSITMHQADAAYIWLAFSRLLASSDGAANLAALALCLPVDQKAGAKSAKLINELTEAVSIRNEVDKLAEAFKASGSGSPRTEALEAVAEQHGESKRTIERRLELLGLSKSQLMKHYKIPREK